MDDCENLLRSLLIMHTTKQICDLRSKILTLTDEILTAFYNCKNEAECKRVIKIYNIKIDIIKANYDGIIDSIHLLDSKIVSAIGLYVLENEIDECKKLFDKLKEKTEEALKEYFNDLVSDSSAEKDTQWKVDSFIRHYNN